MITTTELAEISAAAAREALDDAIEQVGATGCAVAWADALQSLNIDITADDLAALLNGLNARHAAELAMARGGCAEGSIA